MFTLEHALEHCSERGSHSRHGEWTENDVGSPTEHHYITMYLPSRAYSSLQRRLRNGVSMLEKLMDRIREMTSV